MTITITARSDRLVAFGEGLERDRPSIDLGQRLTGGLAAKRLRLVVRAW